MLGFNFFSTLTNAVRQASAEISGAPVSLFAAIPAITADNYSDSFSYDITLPTTTFIPSNASVYSGSLSAHGNMVAMQINPGSYKYVPSADPTDVDANGNIRSTMVPYLTGYMREYWRDPLETTFGSTSAIPAITGVMSAQFTSTPGNLLYYVDLQMTRLTGSNFWNNYYFINVVNKVIAWLESTQPLSGVDTSLPRRINHCGFDSLNEYVTQGFNKYKIGNSLTAALNNVGILIQQVPSGYFGTANAVMKTLIDSGLGKILNLFDKLRENNVNLEDLYNSDYTLAITTILQSITDPTQLNLMQGVLGSSVPNMKSAMDYTDIDACAGFGPNDSVFQSLTEFGRDLYNKLPESFYYKTGKEFVDFNITIITLDPRESPDFNPDDLYNTLPTKKLQIQDVIGSASGYMAGRLNNINLLLEQLRQTKYGIPIHSALNTISKAYSKYRAELLQFNGTNSTSVPYTVNNIDSQTAYANAVIDYEKLLEQIAADPETADLVYRLNNLYNGFCEDLSEEVLNYNKINMDVSKFDLQNNDILINFVTKKLKSLSIDTKGFGTIEFILRLSQPNLAGQTALALQSQYRNYNYLQSGGFSIFDTPTDL